MSERRELQVVGPGGSQVADVTVTTEPPWAVRFVLADGSVVEAVGADLFSALETVRRRLEAEGMLVCCQGARPDVFPSGMARQMGGTPCLPASAGAARGLRRPCRRVRTSRP
jgi:hypothetical protein